MKLGYGSNPDLCALTEVYESKDSQGKFVKTSWCCWWSNSSLSLQSGLLLEFFNKGLRDQRYASAFSK
jgi:hypothetical protein